jgi:riboflavin synthase
MFAGIVETLGQVQAVQAEPPGVRLMVRSPLIAADAALGDSIAVNGCCLTVVQFAAETVAFDVGPESLRRTNLGRLVVGSPVNLERSLRLGDRLGGHFVTGHVDAVGTLDARVDDHDWTTCWFQVPPPLTRQMASKGSVAVDGVSLTLVEVEYDRFSVALIPHTLAVTTLGKLTVGDAVNIETDLLAKYVERQLAGQGGAA